MYPQQRPQPDGRGVLNDQCGGHFEAHSAGLEPGTLNPVVVEAMREVGFDISGKASKRVFDYVKSGLSFSHVITVCDEASAQRCPIFVGVTQRLHWSLPDPAAVSGTRDEKLAGTRAIRDMIQERIAAWCAEVCPKSAM